MNVTYKENTELKQQKLLHLYNDVGWTAYIRDPDTLQRAVLNSLYVVTAWAEDELIGLVRIVGDGETIIYIQDILILKKFQRKGIASTLMEKVLIRFEKVRQKVLLTNDRVEVRKFYEKHQFTSCDKGDLVAFARLS
ncbi:GNAT family N-acetyltransferase [Halalkalibacter alkalisediminis]|uniref:GNAT family N-acetyltransferase n=1 Tax=Halalkalibacter alkalisediminis TaxID=935616 RepID=A0ABV6NGS8_9BACI|nr:GNAT family N-acetyltransferase [Halalkalibacter alkalisediminis]